MAYTEEELKKELESQEYQYGFTTDIDSETFPVGLNEDIVKAISKKKNEPEWMTQWRLEAYSAWKKMEQQNDRLKIEFLSTHPLYKNRRKIIANDLEEPLGIYLSQKANKQCMF